MDVRSPLYQSIALIVAGVLFLNPIVATAAQLAVDQAAGGNTSLTQAGNGVPVVNIATPNGSGLSHNKFTDYNVGQQGLILNNATEKLQSTQLGGLIIGNGNLTNGAAGLILNEVTGGNASQLRGYTEVAGRSAAVIVANPHGITCDGCGFIHTPRVTLSTGTPVVEGGRLQRFDVKGGQIAIEGQGLNADNVDQFDLITRSAKINAELYAKKLNIVTGRNEVDATTLAATVKADDGSDKPLLAIDSSALGGMYAGAIRLVGTEAGVGVKLAGDMAASAGDIRIDANGKLSLAQTSSAGDLAIEAGAVELTGKTYAAGQARIGAQGSLQVQQSLAAAGDIRLEAGRVVNQGLVEAGVRADNSRTAADLRIEAQQVRNAGSLIGNRQLEVKASQGLDNQGGTLSAQGSTRISAGQLDNRAGRVLAGGDLKLAAGALDNRQGGLLRSQGAADVQVAGALQNQQGKLVSQAALMLEAGSLDNQGGQVLSAEALQLRAETIDNGDAGVISTQAEAHVSAGSLRNAQAGEVSASGRLQLEAGQLDNSAKGRISAQTLVVQAESLDNRQGGTVFGRQGLQLQAGQVDNREQGRISSQGALTARVKGLDQRGGGQFVSQGGLSLDLAGGRLNNSQQGLLGAPGSLLLTNVAAIDNSQGGEISSDQGFSLLTGELNNRAGRIISAAALELRIARALLNGSGGLLSAGQGLQLRAASLDNSAAGQVASQGDMHVAVNGSLNNGQQGLIASQGAMRVEATAIDNQDRGELSSGAALSLQGTSLDNRGGLIASDAGLALNTSELLDNSQGGVLAAAAALSLEAGQLHNHEQGVIQGDGGVQARVQGAFDNHTGSLRSGRELLLVSGALDNRGGTLFSEGALQARGSSLDASAGGRVVANGAADIQLSGRLDLSAGGRLLSGAALLLRAETIDNHDRGLLFAKGDAVLEANRVDNRQGGEISSKHGLSVQVDTLDNREQGRLIAEAGLRLVADHVLNSALGVLSAGQNLQLRSRVLSNEGGRVLSGALLELSATQVDNSEQGRISAVGDLLLLTEQLDNQQRGEVRSGGALTLHAKRVDAQEQGLIAAAGAATVQVEEALDLSQGGRLVGEGALELQAGSLSTREQGLIAANGDLQVKASTIGNTVGGELSTQGSLTLTAQRLDNQDGGRLIAQNGLSLDLERLNNQRGGVLASQAALLLTARQIDNSAGGTLSGAQLLSVQAYNLDNQGGGRVLSGGAANLVLQQLNNSAAGLLSSRGDLLLQGKTLNNRDGAIVSDGRGKVQADSLDSSAGGLLSSLGDLEVEVASLDQHDGGELLSKGQLDLRTTTLDNRDGGLVSAREGLKIQAKRLSNQGGELSSFGSLSLEGDYLDNSGAGKVLADNALSLRVTQLLNQTKGVLSGAKSLSLQGASLDNSGTGLLLSQGAIDLALTEQLNNREGGTLLAQGPLRIQAAGLDNAPAGLLSSKGDMALVLAGQLDNSTGRIVSDARLELDAERLDNSQGQVASKGDLNLELGQLVQQGGELLSEGRLDLEADSIDNSQASLIAATQGLAVRADTLNNSAKGEVSSQGAVRLEVAELDNSAAGRVIGDAGLWLTVKRLLNHSLGLLSGRTGLVVQADSLDNSQGGTLTSEQGLDLQVSGLLDNHDKGALLSEGALQVRAGTLNNAAGVLSSAGELSIDSGALNNQGGRLVTDAKLTLDSSTLDNSRGGRISARQALAIETGRLDNQHQGLISGAADVSLQATQLNNHDQGRIAAKGTVQVSATALDQHAGGELVSESALTLDLQGGDLDNSGQGLIATPGALLLKNLGKVDNSAGGEISSSHGFLLKARELDNSAGRVISAQALQLQIAQLLKNSLKGVLSGGSLDVTAASLDNSAAGVLASKGDMQVKLTGKLANHDQGTLSAAQGLTVEVAELDNANAGLLASGADLKVTTDALNNQGGSLLSQAGLELASGDLDNRGGVISSRQALDLTAGAIDNRDNGLITSADTLDLRASRLDSSRHLGNSGGELSAKKDLRLTVTQLIQRQGRLIGEAGVRIDLKGGDLDNRGGLLTANGPLNLQALGKLDNRDGGEVSSTQGYLLRASAIDNGEQGRIISAGKLGLDVGTGDVRNAAGGLISGWQGVDIAAGNLDNRARGTVSSRDGALSVKLDSSQRVLNNSDEGALVSKAALEIEATSLDNSAKGIVSSGGDLDLRLSGALDNSGNGLIDTQGTLTANAGAVNNAAGQIGSGKDASLNAASLDNRAGQLTSGAGLGLTLTGDLLNGQQGKLTSAGPLVLKAQDIDNQSGSLISQHLLELTASSLNNVGGTVAARNGLSLLLTGALNNAKAGLIHSQLGSIGIRAQGLDNTAGSLSSQGNLLLTLDGKLDNRSGQLQSRAGNLDLQRSTSVDNRGGVLSSLTGWLKLVSAGLFDNDGGTTQAQTLSVEAQGLNNRGGHLSAVTGSSSIDLGRATFNNQGGGLYAHQLLELIAGDFNNQGAASGQGGKVAAGRIDFGLSGALNNAYGIVESTSSLNLASTGLDNRSGSLRALGSTGDTRITASSLDNRQGRIETANTNLVLDAASLQSSGGSILHVGTGNFGLSAAQVMGAGGDLSTNGLLSLTADSWTNSGVLQAGRLVLNIGTFTQTATGQLLASQSLSGSGGTWINDGLLASDGSLSLDLSGAYSGAGQVTSLGELNLKAASLDLASTARISGGGVSTISSTGTLTNHGRLTSAGGLTVSAATLNNYGTLGSGETLRLVAPNLLNERGLIFSGDDMALRVDNFTNKYGDVYGLGDLSVSRNDANARSATLENISGTIESLGDMRLLASRVVNRKDAFKVSERFVSGDITYQCLDCKGRHYDLYYYIEEKFERTVESDSPAASFVSGGDFSVSGIDFENSYSQVSAAGDISVSVENFTNTGAATSSVTRLTQLRNPNDSESRSVFLGMVGYGGAISEYAKYNSVYQYRYISSAGGGREGRVTSTVSRDKQRTNKLNPNYNPSVAYPLPARFSSYSVVSSTETNTSSGVAANAVIQAGGKVNINASKTLNNGVTRESFDFVAGRSQALDTRVIGTGKTTVVSLNSQLPPDLQQKQVNPLTLPGFTLPQGENGLFRLSSQQTQSATAKQTQSGFTDRTLGGRSVALDQQERSQASVDAQGRSFAIDAQGGQAVATVAATDWQAQASAANLQASGTAATVNVDANPLPSTLDDQAFTVPSSGSAAVQPSRPDVAASAIAGNSQALAPSAQASGIAAPTVEPGAVVQDFSAAPPVRHKYLIETNPALTDLKQFVSSDYLLGNLGYDPDQAQKRLGDGLYEQRLVREAIVARTGQRYLAGLTSDEAMFRYLMDNAVASKDRLGLSLGVTLSAEQVAALTHDIVWLEEHEVAGEKVLVPVLYLAQAKGRLAANGALIQGRDVTLISGGELVNQGTLRASENLTATAGNIRNSGLVEAGNRLQLLATDSIRNAQGGIIAGRDVSLIALTGDVLNERSVTRHQANYGNNRTIQDFVDSAARIEAANDLSLIAGRDFSNLGGVLASRGDLAIEAGRDVNISSVEERVSQARGGHYLNERVTQVGAQVSAGRDLDISAGRDLGVIASRLEAGRDVGMQAGEDLLISSAANESHFLSRSKKVTQSRDQLTQQSSDIHAGRNLSLDAGNDLSIVASRARAGNDVDIDAGNDVQVLSAKDESASFYFKKKKGSFGRSSSKQQESYHSTNIASVLEAGNDLTINTSKAENGGLSIDGGRDVTVIGSQLSAGNDLLLGATGDVAILSGVEEHGSYSKKKKSGFLGLSKSGKSQLKTSATQVASELDAGNDVVVAAGNDIRLRASTAEAGNDLELRSGLVKDTGDINLVSANDTAYSLTEQYKKKVGLSASGGFVSVASAKEAGRAAQSSTSVGSQVTAERDASLQAERDINVIGSGISAGRNLSLDAGRDVNVAAAENESSQRNWEKNKQVGLGMSADDNGVSVFVGAERTQEKIRQVQQTAAASQLSAGQDLDITAGRDINQTGSDLLAANDLDMKAGRNINIDAARESQLLEQQRSQERLGLGVTVNHNFGSTRDAASNAGKGDNGISQASNTLRAVDALNQFLSGPTVDVRLGNSKQSSSQQYTEQSNRASSLTAGNDINMQAGEGVTVKGGQLDAGRDISIKGRDVTLDVAQGSLSQENQQSQSWGGVHGGTAGGAKVGIGGSRGIADADWSQSTSTATQVNAGRDLKLQASNDLSLIATQAQAGRDIDLAAGNDLTIRAAQNASSSESERRSAGGEVGLTLGTGGIGLYASANLGKGQLEREGTQQQEAYLYAGNKLGFDSGRDTTIAGAILRGEEVVGRVGRDLALSSLPDTGKAKGKEFDFSGTVATSGLSGSIGKGKTTGSTNWVQEQTSVTAGNRVDIRTENHTQIDGAVIASDKGNLKLDTGTLGFSDIAGKDKEKSYYLNVGGSIGLAGDTSPQDSSQVGKGASGQNGWSVEGYKYERDREQIVRATVGAGDIVVRGDAETGQDSTAGLNRDTSKAYEITKDKEERTDLYVSQSSVEAVGDPIDTVGQWANALMTYDETAKANFKDASILVNASLNEWERLTGRPLPEGALKAGGKEIAEQALYGLIMSGMSRAEAKALLANEAFQNQVLAELRNISQVFSKDSELLQETEQGLAAAGVDVSPGALQLPPTDIIGKKDDLRIEQKILDRVSAVNAYIEANPEKADTVGFVMAAAQGPKGLIMWAAEQALSETPFGEKVAQYQAYLQGVLGKAVAEGVERDELDEQYEGDAYLIGGGSLIATLLVGAAGSKTVKVVKTKENASPSANQNPHAGHADNESGLNKGAVRHDAEPTVHEKKIADEIAADGQDVILRGANTPGPDAIINGKYWEIKEITGNGGRTLQNNIRDARSQFGNEGSIALGLNPSEARVLIDARGSKVWNDPATVRSEIAKLASTGGLRDVVELKVVTSAGVVTWRP